MNKFKSDAIMIIITILFSIAIFLCSKNIYSGGFIADKLSKNVEYCKATVTSIINESLEKDQYLDNVQIGSQAISLEISSGDLKGNEYEIVNRISRLYNYKVSKGTKVIVGIYRKDGEISDISIYSYDRSGALIGIISIFLAVIIIIGGIRGLKAIVSLIFTIVSIIYLMIPLMLRGVSPIFSAIIIAILSVVITMILISGKSKKTIVAILGTILGVIISGTIALIFGKLAHLSGITMEDAESIMYIAEGTGLKVTGIMFAGILVASLGAVMDVAMSISSSVFEIYEINQNRSSKELFISGMNIGRDVIGTMANTLILAFAGGSLTTLLMIFTSNMTADQLFNIDIVGTEIIQGVAGSIGIVLTVPITALIASYLYKNDIRNKHKSYKVVKS